MEKDFFPLSKEIEIFIQNQKKELLFIKEASSVALQSLEEQVAYNSFLNYWIDEQLTTILGYLNYHNNKHCLTPKEIDVLLYQTLKELQSTGKLDFNPEPLKETNRNRVTRWIEKNLIPLMKPKNQKVNHLFSLLHIYNNSARIEKDVVFEELKKYLSQEYQTCTKEIEKTTSL